MKIANFEILFSELASKKLEELSFDRQEKIINLIERLSSSFKQIMSSKDIKKLNDNFYILRVDKELRIIFSIENNNLFVTDISSYKYVDGPLPDPQTLEYYKNLDPEFPEKIMKLAEREMEHRIQIKKEILNREMYYDRLGILVSLIMTLVGISVSTYLLIWTEKYWVSIIVLITTILPITWRLTARFKKKNIK